ncbi:MAG TPA: hypothetical protein VFD73_12600 [Gemmatimonadales bacterium]|nr:hypothetical protein [Gemmatimonadales bacterium]
MNELLPAVALGPGEVAAARNNRCRSGDMEPRRGLAKLPWTNRVTTGAASVPVPFGVIHGVGRFRDSDDTIWGLIAADGRIYRTRESNGAVEVPLPSGVLIEGPVHFEQAYHGLVAFRGAGQDVLHLTALDQGFNVITELTTPTGTSAENPTDGTEAIPSADRGSWIGGRMFVPYATATEKDMVAISDYLNATRYLPIRSQARINQGSSDALISVLPFGKTTSSSVAICFKAASIYALYGVQGSLAQMQQDIVTGEYGLCGPKAALNVGRDEADAADEVWFLAMKKGICRITYDRDGRLGVSRVLPSDEMQRTMDRVNWRVAQTTATFALWDQKLYAALPLDDAQAQGPALLTAGQVYSGSSYVHFVEPGATYYWEPGSHEVSLTNGTETLTDKSTFVAQGISITLAGTGAAVTVTALLRRVWVDVNNAVLVHDFLTGKWQGQDDGSAIVVKDWLTLPHAGAERLFALGADGFINLYEELPHDDTATEALVDVRDGFFPGTWLGYFDIPVTRGKRYAYALNAYVTSITNGTETLTAAAGVFTAQASRITYNGPAGTFAPAPVYEITWTIVQEEIDHDWTTRAYRTGVQRQRNIWAKAQVSTWWPSLTIYEVTNGVSESVARLTGRTRSRTTYNRPFDRAPWDETNYNDDHATAGREDYAVLLSEARTASGAIVAGVRYLVESSDVTSACSIDYNGVTYSNGQTFVGVASVGTFTVLTGTPLVYPPGSYLWLDRGVGSGVDPDLHQDWDQDVKLRGRGGSVQMRIRNQQGRCVTKSIGLYSEPADKRPGGRT